RAQPLREFCRPATVEPDRLAGHVGIRKLAEQFRLVLVGFGIHCGPAVLEGVDEILPLPATRLERRRASRMETAPRGGPRGVGDLATRQVLRTVPPARLGLRDRREQRTGVR